MRHVPTPFEHNVVVRRIERPLAAVHLPGTLTVGALQITGPFVEDPTALTAVRRASARVGRTRVAIEVAEWSDRACELRVVPATRRLQLWGARRQRRYFARVHDAADQLVDLLLHCGALSTASAPEGALVPRLVA